MDIQKQLYLKQKFPTLYTYLPNMTGQRNVSFDSLLKSASMYPIAFGLECGDGWYELIYNLSEKLENLNQNLKLVQCKEKYGTLRYYLESDTDESMKLIDEAETNSEHLCEICGKPGTLESNGWWKVRCEEHKDL